MAQCIHEREGFHCPVVTPVAGVSPSIGRVPGAILKTPCNMDPTIAGSCRISHERRTWKKFTRSIFRMILIHYCKLHKKKTCKRCARYTFIFPPDMQVAILYRRICHTFTTHEFILPTSSEKQWYITQERRKQKKTEIYLY